MSDDWVAVVLAGWRRGQDLAAVGPGPLERHLEHGRALAALLPMDARHGLDLGSGAGIPGLVLAGVRPDMRWVLVDAARRRTRLVSNIVDAAGWTGRVDVVHDRAELAGRNPRWRRRFDVVTARSFGPPPVTAECAAPFVRSGGRILVAEPPTAGSERWSVEGLATLGLTLGERLQEPAVQALDATGELPDRFPRKPGVPGKRPLW